MVISKDTTNVLKALLPLIIVLHHLSFRIEGLELSIFSNIGMGVVAVFFFISGYGLFQSLNNKKNYLKNFFRNRLSAVLIPYIISIVIYQLFSICVYGYFPLKNISNILYGDTNCILPASWYIIIIVVLYGLFWLCFHLNLSYKKQILALLLIGGGLLVILRLCQFSFYWYGSIGGFFLGIIHSAICKHTLNKSGIWMYMIATALMTIFTFYIPSVIGSVLFYAFLSLLVVILAEFMPVGFFSKAPILRFLSKISYEIYLTHVIVYRILRCDVLYIRSDFFYLILCFILTFVLSYIVMIISEKIKKYGC